MFGTNEMVVLGLAVIFLLFGAKKIPEFARSLGQAKGEFERGQLEVGKEVRESRLKDYDNDNKNSVQKAAKELGIDITEKSEDELKRNIVEKLDEDK